MDTKENHRVFLGPQAIVINENKKSKETSLWTTIIEKASETFVLNEFFGSTYRNAVLGIMGLLILFGKEFIEDY